MKKLILICTIAVVLAGCQKQETKTGAVPQKAADAVVSTQSTTTQPAPAAAPAAAPEKVSGTIAETLDSAGFTYVRLVTDKGDKWVVVRQTPLKKGAPLTITVNMVADKFESKSLKKSFDKLIFGEIEGAAPPPQTASMPGGMASAMSSTTPSAMPTGMMSPHAGAPPNPQPGAEPPVQAMNAMMKAQHSGMAAGPPDDTPIKVAKAEGENAKTVAEIWAARATTHDGQPIVVRGKVVKFLSGIMGKNWIHVRDGSGSREKGDNDITITTNDTVAVGNVVLVSGVLHVNKDFGAGYSYPIIIEEAKVK